MYHTCKAAVTIIMHDNGGGVLMEVWKGATTRVGHKNVGGGGGGGRSIIVVLWKRFNSGWEENK